MSQKIQLNEGFGAIPDRTGAVNERSPEWYLRSGPTTTTATWLSPNALGEYVACVVNNRGDARRMVFGSLGFGDDPPAWVLGGPQVKTVKDFAKRWHAWLEDDQGRITDIVTPQWHDLAVREGKVISGWDPDDHVVLIDEDPEALAAGGLHYIPADPEVQGVIREISARAFAPVLEKISLT